jgi:hypothetical protein
MARLIGDPIGASQGRARGHPGLSSPRPGHDHIGLPSAAAGADKPLAPIEDAGVGAIPSSHLCRVRLDLMLARLTPHDKPDLGSGSGTERHRRSSGLYAPLATRAV